MSNYKIDKKLIRPLVSERLKTLERMILSGKSQENSLSDNLLGKFDAFFSEGKIFYYTLY